MREQIPARSSYRLRIGAVRDFVTVMGVGLACPRQRELDWPHAQSGDGTNPTERSVPLTASGMRVAVRSGNPHQIKAAQAQLQTNSVRPDVGGIGKREAPSGIGNAWVFVAERIREARWRGCRRQAAERCPWGAEAGQRSCGAGGAVAVNS